MLLLKSLIDQESHVISYGMQFTSNIHGSKLLIAYGQPCVWPTFGLPYSATNYYLGISIIDQCIHLFGTVKVSRQINV